MLVALHAVVVFLLHVGPQVGRLGEPVAAHHALERLLPRVHHHVVQQRLPGGELLLTHAAHQELVPRVNSLVLLHVALPLELLATPGLGAPVAVLRVELLWLEVDHEVAPELPRPVPHLRGKYWKYLLIFIINIY